MRHALLSAVFFILVAPALGQTSRYVATTGSDTGDCSEEASPCETISYAVGVAGSGDTIEIGEGEFTETDGLFIAMSLSLHGTGEAGTIIQAHPDSGMAEGRVLTIYGNHEVEISNVTVQNGYITEDGADGGGIFLDGGGSLNLANVTIRDNVNWVNPITQGGHGGGMYCGYNSTATLTDVTFIGNTAIMSGGGMHNYHCSATLINTIFNNNFSNVGGALYNANSSVELTEVDFSNNTCHRGCGIFNSNSSPILTNVTFTRNRGVGSFKTLGGGILNSTDSNPTLTNVTFSENSADVGAGMNIIGGSPTLSNVTFVENVAVNGGGMRISTEGEAILRNVAFLDNTAENSGGGLYLENTEPHFVNVLLANNAAGERGGGLYNNDGNPWLENITITANTSADLGGGIFNDEATGGGDLHLRSAIVWGNSAVNDGNEFYTGEGGFIDLYFVLMEWGPGDAGGDGEIACAIGTCLSEDPLFIGSENGDFRLSENSPAIDVGDWNAEPEDFPVNEDGEPVDLAGNPRFFGNAIDMGAFEWNPNIANEPSPTELAGGLGLPHPNPAWKLTSFELHLSSPQWSKVEVFDGRGRRVTVLKNGILTAGTHTLTWDSSGAAPGVYLIRAETENTTISRSVTIVR